MTTADSTAQFEADDHRRSSDAYRPLALLSRALRVTEGQAITLLVGLAVTGALTLGGLPQVLRHHNASDSGAGVSQLRPADSAAPGMSQVTDEPAAPAAAPGTVGAPAAAPNFAEPATSSFGASATTEAAPESASFAPPALGTAVVFARVRSPGAPFGLAVGPDGKVYVGTDNGTGRGEAGPSRVLSFGPDGKASGEITITGQPSDHTEGIAGLAFAPDGTLLAIDAATDRILRVDVGAESQDEVGKLADLPSCPLVVVAEAGCEPGMGDDAPAPRGVAVDERGGVYVTDAAQGTIWRVSTGGKPEPWFAASQFGSGNGLAGIAVDPAGSLLVAVPEALDPSAPGRGGVYRIPVTADGTPGTPSLVVSFPRGALPTGLARLAHGSLAISLTGANAVVLVDAKGAEVRRVTGDLFDAPSGLAVLDGTVLSANTAPGTKEKWGVLAVGLR